MAQPQVALPHQTPYKVLSGDQATADNLKVLVTEMEQGTKMDIPTGYKFTPATTVVEYPPIITIMCLGVQLSEVRVALTAALQKQEILHPDKHTYLGMPLPLAFLDTRNHYVVTANETTNLTTPTSYTTTHTDMGCKNTKATDFSRVVTDVAPHSFVAAKNGFVNMCYITQTMQKWTPIRHTIVYDPHSLYQCTDMLYNIQNYVKPLIYYDGCAKQPKAVERPEDGTVWLVPEDADGTKFPDAIKAETTRADLYAECKACQTTSEVTPIYRCRNFPGYHCAWCLWRKKIDLDHHNPLMCITDPNAIHEHRNGRRLNAHTWYFEESKKIIILADTVPSEFNKTPVVFSAMIPDRYKEGIDAKMLAVCQFVYISCVTQTA
jgi:hypothetical protein